MVLTRLLIFGATSLACGLAPSTGVFLIGVRIVQGVAAALLLPGTLAIITRAFPDRGERARAIGICGSVALPAAAARRVARRRAGWRRVPRDVPRAGGRPDVAGTAAGALFLAATTLAVIEAGHAGTGAVAVLAIAVAAAAMVGFLVVERSAPDPMLPLELFGVRRSPPGTASPES